MFTRSWIEKLHHHGIHHPSQGSEEGVLEELLKEMPRGIGIDERIISGISIPIEILRIAGAADERIRGDKPAESGVIISGLVVVEVGAGVKLLACVLIRHIHGRGGETLIRAGGNDKLFISCLLTWIFKS